MKVAQLLLLDNGPHLFCDNKPVMNIASAVQHCAHLISSVVILLCDCIVFPYYRIDLIIPLTDVSHSNPIWTTISRCHLNQYLTMAQLQGEASLQHIDWKISLSFTAFQFKIIVLENSPGELSYQYSSALSPEE